MRIEVLLLVGVAACGGDGSAAVPDAAPHLPGTPALGAHGLSFYGVGQTSAPTISTPALATHASGSTIVVGMARGNKTLFTPASAPADNQGNGAYPQVGGTEPYLHPNEDSATAVYALAAAHGGPGLVITTTTGMSTGGNTDEITLAAVEVVDASRIQDFAWNVVAAPAVVRSHTVTTTGPAVLIAFWWGDATSAVDQTATADNGFVVVDFIGKPGSFIQGAVAVKSVSAAGSYDVTWTATPAQGAQLWLVAVQ